MLYRQNARVGHYHDNLGHFGEKCLVHLILISHHALNEVRDFAFLHHWSVGIHHKSNNDDSDECKSEASFQPP